MPEPTFVGSLAAAGLGISRAAAAVMAGMLPGAARTGWRELENKLHAFEWFSVAGRRLGLDAAGPAVRAAALPDAYTGLWATEGVGYACARAAVIEDLPARGLLSGSRGGDLPPDSGLGGGHLAELSARAAVPLTTGSALAAAEGLLAAVAQAESRGRPDREAGREQEREGGRATELVRHWLERCRDDLRPGYPELAVEALGLVARTLQPWRLPRLDELLAAADPVLAEYLWHGVGRGLYFLPMHLLPWSGGCRRAFAKARSEPPHEAGRRNATAGLAWASTLVNVRSPEVAAAALAGCDEEPDAERAIANGASSALLVWRQWAGADRLLDCFLAYQPRAAGRALRWRRRVIEPCRTALAAAPPDFRRGGQLAALFRFQVAPDG